MRIYKDIDYVGYGHPMQKLNIYLPDDGCFHVYVHLHGGGLEVGSRDVPEDVAEEFCDNGVALVSVEYRMYPTAVYPEFICDAAAAVAWSYKNMANYGMMNKFFVGGSSAGGYLSMMLCFDKKYLAPYGIDPVNFGGFVHDAGQPTAHFNVLRERGIDSRRVIIDESAPLYHIGTSPEYPPMLFIVADQDMPGRYEQTMLVLATLRDFGYDMSKVEHKVMHATHTAYYDENGKHLYAELVCDYIMSRR